jgi:hypothetical protein
MGGCFFLPASASCGAFDLVPDCGCLHTCKASTDGFCGLGISNRFRALTILVAEELRVTVQFSSGVSEISSRKSLGRQPPSPREDLWPTDIYSPRQRQLMAYIWIMKRFTAITLVTNPAVRCSNTTLDLEYLKVLTFFILFIGLEWKQRPLLPRPLTDLLYQPRMIDCDDDDC